MIPRVLKANRILQIILGAFLLILFRIWHLAVIQRDAKLHDAEKAQVHTIVEPAQRGMIVDRFGIPLATNRICYHVAIYYNQFLTFPTVAWESSGDKERKKKFPRKTYIHDLSSMLAEELHQEAQRIEDLLYAKASLLPHAPFVIASDISEEQYYRLKGKERLWPGLRAEISSQRIYPQGKAAGSLVGYLGAISQDEYITLASELAALKEHIQLNIWDDEALREYETLKEQAYTINDRVGKAGIERQYERELRGIYGKKAFRVTQQGHFLAELPDSRPPVAGKTVTLSLSCELQKFCESLLIASESRTNPLKTPFIKGGAIVALDPNSGEVLALASTPRFDPNDMKPSLQKPLRTHRWLETPSYVESLWDGTEKLYREKIGRDETTTLTWETYLDWILPKESGLRDALSGIQNIKNAVQLQEDFEALLFYSGHPDPALLMDVLFPNHPSFSKKTALDREQVQKILNLHDQETTALTRRIERFLKGISHNGDKLFALDLTKMVIYSPAFTNELISQIGSTPISTHRLHTQSLMILEERLLPKCRELFHHTTYAHWRSKHEKEFLKEKRAREKEQKTYARPYIDYLDKEEKRQFSELWQSMRHPLVASLLTKRTHFLPESMRPYFDLFKDDNIATPELQIAAETISDADILQWLKTLRPFRDLQRPLWGSYQWVQGIPGCQTEQDLARSFYPKAGFGFALNLAFQGGAPMGSIFKLVTACEALYQNRPSPKILTMVDTIQHTPYEIVGQTADHKPIPRTYKGGRLPRSHLPNMGMIDLIGALERSSNPYFSLLASDLIANPDDLLHTARSFGIGVKSMLDLPGERQGHLPNDLSSNRTGLYSFAIGQHTLVTTPIQVANMLASIANGGKLYTPHLVKKENNSKYTEIAHLTPAIRTILCEGMDHVVWGSNGSARPSIINQLASKPELLHSYLSLQHQMIGKTSTAEISCRTDCNPSARSAMYKHIWFGAISFGPEAGSHDRRKRWDKPELVVVVFLRYGDGGKSAAPIAAQVIHKWRELIAKNSQ